MRTGELGIVFDAGQFLFRHGEQGDRMYVIQEGQAEVIVRHDGRETRTATLGPHDFVGEEAMFERVRRRADVRAITSVRVVSVDRRNFLRRMNEDPSLVLRILEQLSRRVCELSDEVARLRDETRVG
jgi:CRP-like cAMP-binding protein